MGFQDISKKDVGDFSIRGYDCLYPSVLLKYYAIGLSDRVKSRTQKKSPCGIPLLTLILPTVSLPLLVVNSRLMFHVFIADFDKMDEVCIYAMHLESFGDPLM